MNSFLPNSIEEFSRIFEASPIGVAAADVDGFYLFANTAYAKLYGYNPHDLNGKRFMDIKTSDSKRAIQDEVLRLYFAGEATESSFLKWDRRNDGTSFLAKYDTHMLLNGSSESYWTLVFVQDVTEVHSLRVKLLELEEITRKNEVFSTVGKVTGGVVHDLNNRLSVVMSMASLMRMESSGLSPEHLDMASEMITATRQAADLTSSLLVLLRQSSATRDRVDIRQVVQHSVSLAKRISCKSIQWFVEVEGDELCIVGDRNQLQNAIFNIILNATESVSTDGEIRVWIDSECDGEQCAAVIHIHDSGTGIPEPILEKIFDPLFSTKTSKGGTGLGLAITKNVIESHQGRITVESSTQAGTHFSIYLPCGMDSESGYCGHCKNQPDYSSLELKLLLVDDDDDVLRSTCTSLSALGFKCHSYSNPQEAKCWYQSHFPEVDLIILDMMLPGMIGIDIMHDFARVNPKAPILLTSGYAIQVGVAESIKENRFFLKKPYTVEELHGAIHSLHTKSNLREV